MTNNDCSAAISAETHSRAVLSVEEVAALFGIGRTAAYEAVRRGEIPSVRIGRRILVPRAALEALLGAEETIVTTEAQGTQTGDSR